MNGKRRCVAECRPALNAFDTQHHILRRCTATAHELGPLLADGHRAAVGALEVLLIGVPAKFVNDPRGIDAGPRVPIGDAGGKREHDTVRNGSHTLITAGDSLVPWEPHSERLQFVVDRFQTIGVNEHYDVVARFDDGITTGDDQFAVAADSPDDYAGRQFLY